MTKVIMEKMLEDVYNDGCNSDSTKAESEPAPKLPPRSIPANVTAAVMPGEMDASQAKQTLNINESNVFENIAQAGQSETVTKTKSVNL